MNKNHDNFDLIIVGGGIVSSYLIKRLSESNLKIGIIDKQNFELINNSKFESIYYNDIINYGNKKFGGLSDFWGGQIQDIDDREFFYALKGSLPKIELKELVKAKNIVVQELNLRLNKTSIFSLEDTRVLRVLNSWLGSDRFIGANSFKIIKNKNFRLISGKVTKIIRHNDEFDIEYLNSNLNKNNLSSKKVIICCGTFGLAEYLLSNNKFEILFYKDHYSINLGEISVNTILGKALVPFFSSSSIVTPRIYFGRDKPDKNFSLYSSLPFQDSLRKIRNKQALGILAILRELLYDPNRFQLILFLTKLLIAKKFNLTIPFSTNLLNINAFIDSSLIAKLEIKKQSNVFEISKLQIDHFLKFKYDLIAKLSRIVKLENTSLNSLSNGFHAYALTDKNNTLASSCLKKEGIIVIGPSELDNIGDINPVFATLISAEIVLQNLK